MTLQETMTIKASSERRLRKFNPGTFQSDAEVIDQFVVRKRELDIVLEVLHGNVDTPSCQHVLLVAPRGHGKTMLLARVAAELRNDPALSTRLFPVRFMEESQEIFNLADFWLESLGFLATDTAARHPDISQQLRDTHAELTARWHDSNIEERAFAAVREAADRLDTKLVLMVENLQALSGATDGDFGRRLRNALRSAPQIMLLATATSRFSGLDDATQPFFELFRIVRLNPLDTEECRRLWQMVSGDPVSRRAIRPLEILTGGNPRLLVIVGAFARHRSLRQLTEELVTLIDDHTEYFRGHMDVLAKTERRVYLAVIDLWQPSSTGEIAARARMDVRAVSTMLGRLVDRGLVQFEGTGRKRLYSAAERLYCIYYKLRRQRDEAALVTVLLRFMAMFYLARERNEPAWELSSGARLAEGPSRALTEASDLGRASSSPFTGERTEDMPENARVSDAPDRQAEVRSGREVVTGLAETLQEQVAQALVSKGLAQAQVDAPAAMAAYDAVVTRFSAAKALALQELVALALVHKGFIQGEIGEFVAAITTYDEIVARYAAARAPALRKIVARALVYKGLMQGQIGEPGAAITTYDEFVIRFDESEAPALQELVAMVLVHKGVTQGQIGEFTAAIAAYEEVVARYADADRPALQKHAAKALVSKGEAQVTIGRAEEALDACDELERRFGRSTDDEGIPFEWHAKCVRTAARLVQGERVAAMDSFRLVYSGLVSDDEAMMHALVERVPDLIAAGAPPRDLAAILLNDPEKAATLQPLVIALRQLAGDRVRAPAEVVDVAHDVRAHIEERKPVSAKAGPA